MKKILMALLFLSLFGCESTSTVSLEQKKDNFGISYYETDVFISEYIEGTGSSRALELYNMGDNEVSLKDYQIRIYANSEEKPAYTIPLSGTLGSKQTYVIAYPKSDPLLLEKADLQSDNLMYNGSYPIALAYKGKNMDVLGTIGYVYKYQQDVTLVRKPSYFFGRPIYEEYDWVRYPCDDFSHVGNVDLTVTQAELMAGPKLTQTDLDRPFFKDNDTTSSIAGGGVLDVTFSRGVDGDTAFFTFPSWTLLGTVKVRFQNIDTPESMVDLTQPWGIPAKNYTTQRLQNAKKIQIQSVIGNSVYETFGRVLGWVWIDGELLNHTLVYEGYTFKQFDSLGKQFYKDVAYEDYLNDVYLYAKKMGWKLHGEVDPTWPK